MGPCAWRSYADRPIAGITAKCSLREYHYSNWCNFKICICLSSFRPHNSKHSESLYRHHDKHACLPTLSITDKGNVFGSQVIHDKHACLPKLIITDKGSVFVSQVIHEVAEIIGIYLEKATKNYAQTIGVLKRAQATIKTSLKMASSEHRKQWHKSLPIAILKYNTTYHSSTDCQPSLKFHGRVPHNIPDHKLGLRYNPNIAPTTDFAEQILRRTKILIDKTKKKVMQLYVKYKWYYDKKARAAPLKKKDYCFILHLKAKLLFRDFRWIEHYVVEKILPNKNYIAQNFKAKKTQLLHRKRRREHNPKKPPGDNYQEAQQQIDDNIVIPQDELYTLAREAESGG